MSSRHRIKYEDEAHTLATQLASSMGVPTSATVTAIDHNGACLLNGTVDSVADAGGGDCTFGYTGHAVAVGDLVTVAGTISYDAEYTVTGIGAGTFDAVAVFVADETGTYTLEAQATLLTPTTLDVAVSAGEDALTLVSVAGIKERDTIHLDAPHEDVEVLTVDAATRVVILSEYLVYSHASGAAVSGRDLSYVLDASQSDFTSGLDFNVVWDTDLDDPAWREDAEVLKRMTALGGLEQRFASLYPHYYAVIGAGEFSTHKETAYSELRQIFMWRAGRDIDKLVNPDDVEPVLIRQIAFNIAFAGDDSWEKEREATRTERDDWLNKMSNAAIWIDSNQDDVKDEDEVQTMSRPLPRRQLY